MAAQMLPGASMLSGRRAVPAAHSARTVGISGLGAWPGGALRPLQTCQPRSKRTKVVVREVIWCLSARQRTIPLAQRMQLCQCAAHTQQDRQAAVHGKLQRFTNPMVHASQVTSTETVPSDAATSAAYAAAAAAVSASNGNGNGNGIGNGNGNGQKAAAQLSSRLNSVAANAAAASSLPVTVADINAAAMPGAVANGTAVELNGAVANGTAVKLNGAVANGTAVKLNGAIANGNGNGSTAPYVLTATTTNTNGTAATVAVATDSAQTAAAWKLMNTIDEEQNAEAAGQLELAAATAGASSSRASGSASSSGSGASSSTKRSAAGTPYRNPGGRWSKFKSYSVFQVGLAYGCHDGIYSCMHTHRLLHVAYEVDSLMLVHCAMSLCCGGWF